MINTIEFGDLDEMEYEVINKYIKLYYTILEVDVTESYKNIKKQYYKLSKLNHPDRDGGNKHKFQSINNAYEYISDAKNRIIYDTKIKFIKSVMLPKIRKIVMLYNSFKLFLTGSLLVGSVYIISSFIPLTRLCLITSSYIGYQLIKQ